MSKQGKITDNYCLVLKTAIMKTKMRYWFNVLLSAILGFMGFGLFSCAKYGTPTRNLTIEGEITDESQKPLPKMQVINRVGNEGFWLDDSADTLYTNTKGKYYKKKIEEIPPMFHQVIVNDPSGVYQSDTVVAAEEGYVDKNGEYNYNLKVDFTLKKK